MFNPDISGVKVPEEEVRSGVKVPCSIPDISGVKVPEEELIKHAIVGHSPQPYFLLLTWSG